MPASQKDGQTPSKRRQARARKLRGQEIAEKNAVRLRDGRCRFPLCGCDHPWVSVMKRMTTVSHDYHKGMGGDPSGAVSIASLMIALCKWRHQDGAVSRHARTLLTKYLTPDQNDGPVAFLIDMAALRPGQYPKGAWFEVAREDYDEKGHVTLRLEQLTDEQREVLGELAEMQR